MRRFHVLVAAGAAIVTLRLSAAAQTSYEVVHAFSGSDGAQPLGTLLPIGTDWYGTTSSGGVTGTDCTSGCGTAFRLDAQGTLTSLHSFDSATEGYLPRAGLIPGGDGNFYGTTVFGGAVGDGTVFRMDGTGAVTTIHDFDRDSGGWFPTSPLILATDGEFYGTTEYGLCDDTSQNCAIVFRMTTNGDLTVLHTFDQDGGFNPIAPLVQISDGDFWGTTSQGGGGNPDPCGPGCGTVFRMSGGGTLTPMHAFAGDDGNLPIGALIQGSDGFLYGVTVLGGTSGQGTIFRMDPLGAFVSLHSFDGSDGALPHAGLVQASDGNFYGTTEFGGAFGFGTVFRMDPAGNVIKLHDFDGTSGNAPTGSTNATAELAQGSDGRLYGARWRGGDQNSGFLYRISLLPVAPLFCPDSFVRRDQMAVFLLKAKHGSSYTPPTCLGIFSDVSCPSLFADWIEDLSVEGVTAGCGGGDYCPLSPITRAQMAVFLLRTEHGPGYAPPACTGVFADVPCSNQFAAWIEALASEGITAGCGNGDFCPANPVTRAQMAVFLLKIEHGSSYVPPICAGLFGDVPCPSLFANWIERLFSEGITAGCSS